MPALMADELFNAQLVRAIGYAPYGGADFGDCVSTAARIAKVDVDLWHTEWLATADRVRAEAIASLDAGATVSARGAFLRAANYYRTSGLFLMCAPVDPRLLAAHRREVESLRAGAALLELPPEIVAIPYEASTLPGYFFRAGEDSTRRPTVILVNGYDGTAEELYFTNAAAALARGYNVLCFDGPGQGALIIDHGVPFRPDWEAVITPVVDFAVARADVDPGRIAVMGLSFGAISRRGPPLSNTDWRPASLTADPTICSTPARVDYQRHWPGSFPMAIRPFFGCSPASSALS